MMPVFDSLNNLQKLDFLVGDSPEELRGLIQSIHHPVQLLGIYAVGSKHIAWILTDANLVKKTKKGIK